MAASIGKRRRTGSAKVDFEGELLTLREARDKKKLGIPE